MGFRRVVFRSRGPRPKVHFLSPFDRKRANEKVGEANASGIEKLGYPPLQRGHRDGVDFIVQQCAEGMSYTVAWTSFHANGEWILCLTVQMANGDPVPLALDVLRNAKRTGVARLEKTHRAWWQRYWSKGHIRLPDARIERLWYAGMYKLGARAREEALPMP